MELTEKKLAANRLNAKKSTGPRSLQGKLASSANSGRHRALTATVVLDTEAPQRFPPPLTACNAEHSPQDSTEQALANRMAVSHCRLLRAWAMEAAALSYEQNHQ